MMFELGMELVSPVAPVSALVTAPRAAYSGPR
jgi:hypothetical protein